MSFSFKVERRDWQQMLSVVCPETMVVLNSCWRKMCAEHLSLKFVCQSNFYRKIFHEKDKLSSLLTGQHNIWGRIYLAVHQEAFHGHFHLVTYWIQMTRAGELRFTKNEWLLYYYLLLKDIFSATGAYFKAPVGGEGRSDAVWLWAKQLFTYHCFVLSVQMPVQWKTQVMFNCCNKMLICHDVFLKVSW